MVIETKVATEPNECFLHKLYIRANSYKVLTALGLGQVKIDGNDGYDLFYSLESGAVLY